MVETLHNAWNRFERRDKSKTWVFEIKIEGQIIFYRVGLQGAKTNTLRRAFQSDELAKQAYESTVSVKEKEGYRFIQAKL